LQNVRNEGDWESWLKFFMVGVKETSEQAVETAKSLVSLFDRDRQKVQSIEKLAGSALRVHHALQQKPVVAHSQSVRHDRSHRPDGYIVSACFRETGHSS
jgi:Fic family protein